LAVAAVTVASGALTACNDDPSADACKTVGAAGGIVTSADGVLSLSFRPNSLDEDTEVCIAKAGRPGPPAVYGEAYRVTPDIDVDVNISVTYRAPLPQDTSLTRVGVILKADYEQGQGRWLSLPLTRLEPENELVAGTDTRISMFYGLLDDGGEGMIDLDDDGDSASGSGSDTDATASGSSGGDTDTDGLGGETGDASDSDPTVGDETGGPGESTGSPATDSDSDTGGMAYSCDNLPMEGFDITQIASLNPGSPEDLAMTGQGTFVLADGDVFVEMDAEGNTTPWSTGLPWDEDILGIRFDSHGTLYAAMGLNSSDLWGFTPDGGSVVLATGLQLPNAIHVDSHDDLWVSDYFGDSITRIDPDAGTLETVVTTQANAANGLFFDENRSIIFWANYQSSQIWSAPVNNGVVGAPVGVADLQGFSDGMTMDECGNLYVVDQGGQQGNNPCRIDRIPLDATGQVAGDVVEIASAGELGNACANAQFGYGFGDENDRSLFITGQAGNVYRMGVGVEGYAITLPY